MSRKTGFDIDRFKKRHGDGLDDDQLASEFKINPATVRYHRNKHELAPNSKQNDTVDLELFRQLYSEGANDEELGYRFDIPQWRVRRIRRQLGYGNKLPRNIDYDAIRFLYDQKLSDSAIADKLGICAVTVGNWRRANELPIRNEQYRNMINKRRENTTKFMEDDLSGKFKVVEDEDSLFSDTDFLENLMNRKLG
jgi:hypothetical protein